jgi:hypothetical protein
LSEGYIYAVYGDVKYLKHAIASAHTLRRYDSARPIALVCEKKHETFLAEHGLSNLFSDYARIDDRHKSIVGFKHNLHQYKVYDKSIFLDSDIIWCKPTDKLWEELAAYDFTITGNLKADSFFGARKNFGVLLDILQKKRLKTLNHFDLTYLPRVQSGFVYAADKALTTAVCTQAADYLSRIDETHFVSRLNEKGRNEESCEWSLAMAMSKLGIAVYPWLQGLTSIQLDYISELTKHDASFKNVVCIFYSDPLIYSFRGIKTKWLMNLFIKIWSSVPGKGDYYLVTPYCLHFGWFHEKKPFQDFSDACFKDLTMRVTER